ncbi:MAG: DUF3276 family protein, partial [Bacteroidales bacterium]|nr:DUF3276 family protein [Bacteroidales bacterium]
MEEFDKYERREEIFAKAVRAGKRTYFFDVKATKANEYYLTITESKRRFNNEQGKFYYEKHKLFLYKEDFEKFALGFEEAISYIQTNQPFEKREEVTPEVAPEAISDKTPDVTPTENETSVVDELEDISKKHEDVEFEDLGEESES